MKKETVTKVVYLAQCHGESVHDALTEAGVRVTEAQAVKDLKQNFRSGEVPENSAGYRIVKVIFEAEKELTPFTTMVTKKDDIDWGFDD